MITNQTLPPDSYGRGCRDRAADENSRHLNGVLLVRRAHFAAVAGYDERMAHYGYDDSDLYARLEQVREQKGGKAADRLATAPRCCCAQELNLTARCLDFGLMSHVPDGHAARGLTRVHHLLHKRASTEP